MAGRQLVMLLAGAVVLAGLLRLALRLRRMRRMLDDRDGPAPRRMLDLLTAGYAGILAAGLVVGLATRSVAWGVGVVAALSALGMLVAVVVLLVLAARSASRGP